MCLAWEHNPMGLKTELLRETFADGDKFKAFI